MSSNFGVPGPYNFQPSYSYQPPAYNPYQSTQPDGFQGITMVNGIEGAGQSPFFGNCCGNTCCGTQF